MFLENPCFDDTTCRTIRAKRVKKQSTSIKLRNGLRKIDETNQKIDDMTTELEKVTELIAVYTKECGKTFTDIVKLELEIDEQKKEINIVCVKLKKNELKYQEMHDLALSDLKLTIPGLDDATAVSCRTV